VTYTPPAWHDATSSGTATCVKASGSVFAIGTTTVTCTATNATNHTSTSTFTVTVKPSGTLTATPNPIQVCDGTGLGVTALSWTTFGATSTEVHVNAPNGALFKAGTSSGSGTTAKTVTEGMVFYLQNVSGGLPLTADNTLATVTMHLTTTGCTARGTITIAPNPIQACDATHMGTGTVTWTSAFATTVEIHVNAPNGTLLATSGLSGSATTGKIVTEGMVFYLQNRSGGLPLTAANTLATVTAHTTVTGCTPTGTLTAAPNPVTVCEGNKKKGSTTFTWATGGVSTAEVHADSPSGPNVGSGISGTASKSVTNGQKFYLQNTSGGLPKTAANTLATVTVTLACQ